MTNQKSKVAIIGLGNIGKALATNLVKGNRSLILADRTFESAKALSSELGSLTEPLEIGDAIKKADIIVFAVYFNVIKELLEKYSKDLEGKIIIDPSNPIAPDDKGGFKKIVGEKESSGELLAQLLPGGAKLAKVFGTLGAETLSKAAWKKPASVEFYATNETSINSTIEELVRDNGFEPVRVGGLDKSIRIEVFGDLHEFGKLGKAVSLEEAKAVI